MNSGMIRSTFVVPSIPASPPTKGWNRTSTHWSAEMTPRTRISAANSMPAGP